MWVEKGMGGCNVWEDARDGIPGGVEVGVGWGFICVDGRGREG